MPGLEQNLTRTQTFRAKWIQPLKLEERPVGRTKRKEGMVMADRWRSDVEIRKAGTEGHRLFS
jgi:hypothetical protein